MKKTACSALSFTFIFLVALISCKPSSKTPSLLLKFNLEKGREYEYNMVWDMDQRIADNETKLSIGGSYTIEVLADEGPTRTLEGTYKSFKLYMKMMDMEVDVDTDKPSPNLSEEEKRANPMAMMAGLFNNIVNKKFQMKVNEEGKVLEVAGYDKILESIVDSFSVDPVLKQQAMASLKDQFSEQVAKDAFAQAFYIFPNKEAKVGDSWEKSYNAGGKMPTKFTTIYTVKEIEGDIVTLDAITKLEKAEGSEMEVRGTQTGKIVIDSKTGLMISGDYIMDMSIAAQGLDLQIKGKGKINGKVI